MSHDCRDTIWGYGGVYIRSLILRTPCWPPLIIVLIILYAVTASVYNHIHNKINSKHFIKYYLLVPTYVIIKFYIISLWMPKYIWSV